MSRKQLLDLLRERPLTLSEIARHLGRPLKEAEAELRHAFRSLRRTGAAPSIEPARCRTCGFAFGPEKLARPGKCPACKGTWIEEARIGIAGAAPPADRGPAEP